MGIASLGTTSRGRTLPEAFAGAAELIQGIGVALVTTVDGTGIMHTRQLPNINTGYDDDLWFLANGTSPLISDLYNHPEVVVTFADRGNGRFIVANGTGRVLKDPARVKQLWHPVLASWLPGGPDDPELALIRVETRCVDLWDYRSDAAKPPAGARG